MLLQNIPQVLFPHQPETDPKQESKNVNLFNIVILRFIRKIQKHGLFFYDS